MNLSEIEINEKEDAAAILLLEAKQNLFKLANLMEEIAMGAGNQYSDSFKNETHRNALKIKEFNFEILNSIKV